MSLRTSGLLKASVSAGRYVLCVDSIRNVRQAYRHQELPEGQYLESINYYWSFMTGHKGGGNERSVKTGWIVAVDGTKFDYGSPEKDIEAFKLAKEQGLIDSGPASQNQHIKDKSIRLSELFQQFLEYKTDSKKQTKPITDKVQKDHRRYFEGILAAIGKDLPIQEITRKILKDAIYTYANLPRRNLKAYKDIDVLELLEMEIPEKDRIAGKTAGEA